MKKLFYSVDELSKSRSVDNTTIWQQIEAGIIKAYHAETGQPVAADAARSFSIGRNQVSVPQGGYEPGIRRFTGFGGPGEPIPRTTMCFAAGVRIPAEEVAKVGGKEVDPRETASMRYLIAGLLKLLKFTPGDKVKTKEMLARLKAVGVRLSPGTIKKYLDLAAKELNKRADK